VFDNASELLLGSGQEAGNIGECDDGDVESIAESDKASCFHGGVDVKAAGKHLRLIGNNADRLALDFAEAGDHVARKRRHNRVELIAVADSLNDHFHVVGLVRILGDGVIENLSRALHFFILLSPLLFFALVPAVLWEVTQQLPCACNRLDIILEHFVADTRNFAVHLGAAQLLLRNLLIDDSLDNVRSGDKHVAGVLHHEDKICQCG